MARKRPAWIDEAAQAALLRAQPEIDALSALLRDADTTRRSALSQARSGRVAIEQGVDQVLPQVRQTEQALQLDRWTPDTTFGNVLAQQRAAATSDLLARRSGAAVAESAQTRQAQAEYGSTVGKARQAQIDLARRVSQEASVLGGTLRREAAQQAVQRRGQDITVRGQDVSAGTAADRLAIDAAEAAERARHNRATENASGPKRLPGGAKLATTQQHASFVDGVGSARATAKRLRAEGRSRREMVENLLNGRPQTTVRVDDKGEKLDQPVAIPAIPKTKEIIASVALDLELDGHVSARNKRELHRRGLSLKKLGFPTQSKRRRTGGSAFAGARGTGTAKTG